MNPSHRGPFNFERGQAHRLIVVAQRFLSLLPRSTPFGQQMMIQPATLLELLTEEALNGVGIGYDAGLRFLRHEKNHNRNADENTEEHHQKER